MRDYAKVSPKFWQGGTGKEVRRRGSSAVVVALYLMSSPHSNMLGLYSQPMLYMAHETGLGVEGASEGLAHCIDAGFCAFDQDDEFVWVYEMAGYQIASELKATDNRCMGIQKDYEALQNNPFLGPFFDRYAASFHMTARREYAPRTAAPQLSLIAPGQAPSQAPTKPRTGAGAGTSSGTEAGTGTPAASSPAKLTTAPRPKREEITLTTYLKNCKDAGHKPLPADHEVRAYCRDAGISDEMLQVAWVVFRDGHTNGTKKSKRYKDWPGHFANAVRGCWDKLWYTDAASGVAWTSRGLQEKGVLDARARTKEGDHGTA